MKSGKQTGQKCHRYIKALKDHKKKDHKGHNFSRKTTLPNINKGHTLFIETMIDRRSYSHDNP